MTHCTGIIDRLNFALADLSPEVLTHFVIDSEREMI
jgi:hypothetical protein